MPTLLLPALRTGAQSSGPTQQRVLQREQHSPELRWLVSRRPGHAAAVRSHVRGADAGCRQPGTCFGLTHPSTCGLPPRHLSRCGQPSTLLRHTSLVSDHGAPVVLTTIRLVALLQTYPPTGPMTGPPPPLPKPVSCDMGSNDGSGMLGDGNGSLRALGSAEGSGVLGNSDGPLGPPQVLNPAALEMYKCGTGVQAETAPLWRQGSLCLRLCC